MFGTNTDIMHHMHSLLQTFLILYSFKCPEDGAVDQSEFLCPAVTKKDVTVSEIYTFLAQIVFKILSLITCRGIKRRLIYIFRHKFLLSREIIGVFLSGREVVVWPAFGSRVFLLIFCDTEQMYFVGWCNGTPQSYDTLCVYNMPSLCHFVNRIEYSFLFWAWAHTLLEVNIQLFCWFWHIQVIKTSFSWLFYYYTLH